MQNIPPSAAPIRILLIADTHLGIDLPLHPRIDRRRRGHDFFVNLDYALRPALDGQVDLVVHGGDLLDRSRIPPAIVEMALAPLIRVAEHGIPVYLVPGNHERSKIPMQLWTRHPNLFLFDRPKTFVQNVRGTSVALAGFPFARQSRDRFGDLVKQTGYQDIKAGVQLLCLHQTVEGAKVGPSGFTFRSGADVIKGQDIPNDLAAVLSGHIHRQQILTRDLKGIPLPAPVIYPGSIERTSFAECKEEKGYMILEAEPAERMAGRLVDAQFVHLYARPMETIKLQVDGKNCCDLAGDLREQLRSMDPNAIVRIVPLGSISAEHWQVLGAASIRTMAPSTMNVNVSTIQPQSQHRAMPPKER